MKGYNCRAVKEKRKKADFSMTWWESEYPLTYAQWRVLVDKQRKSPKNPTRGEFRALLLNFAEERLRNQSPIKTPIERVEAKLDELLRLVKQGVPLSIAMQASESQATQQVGELSAEEKARLNKLLDL